MHDMIDRRVQAFLQGCGTAGSNGIWSTQPPDRRLRREYRVLGPDIRMGESKLLRTLLAADQPPAPRALRKALRTTDTHITECIDAARLPLKAA